MKWLVEGDRDLPRLVDFLSTFANLTQLIRLNRLSQTSVATAEGISLPAIQKLERGLGNLTIWTKALDALVWTLRGRSIPAGDFIGRQVAIHRKRQKQAQR